MFIKRLINKPLWLSIIGWLTLFVILWFIEAFAISKVNTDGWLLIVLQVSVLISVSLWVTAIIVGVKDLAKKANLVESYIAVFLSGVALILLAILFALSTAMP